VTTQWLTHTMILVLGGGWMGSRLCLRNTSRFIATTRNVEKLSELSAMGINAIHFDLLKEETWPNLPPKEDVEATIITFGILENSIPQLNRLWDNHLASDKPVLCFGSSSCFQSSGHDSIVNETAPFSDKTGRVKGEEWIVAREGIILHLSGVIGDHEDTADSHCGYGPSRTIKSWLSKGYFKNGLRILNCIHINDIYKIISILVEKLNCKGDVANQHIRGQRILVSCGSFRVQDFARALNIELLPEIIPPHSTIENSKILCIAKLLALLPEDYEWTLPVSGVEPVSQGLPTTRPLKVDATGASFDRQWELFKINFCGKWQGKTTWYQKDKGKNHGEKLDHLNFIAEMKAAMLPTPVSVIQRECHVYFLDADNAVWHGKDSRFPQDEVVLTYSRRSFNETGEFFCFQGSTGQCGVNTSSNIFGAEVNFFHQRSRSMIAVQYDLDPVSGQLLLESINITPFRCGIGCDFPLKPSQYQARGSIDHLLQSLQGKTCLKLWRSYTRALDETGEMCNYPTKSIQLFSDPDRVVQLFDDDLVCSIPPDFLAGGTCELVFGCFHAPNYAQVITLTYDSNGKIEQYSLEKWS